MLLHDTNALDHLDNVQEDLYMLVGRHILVEPGRVSIQTTSYKDSVECYKALKSLLGDDTCKWNKEQTLNRIKEEKINWNKKRQREAEKLLNTQQPKGYASMKEN